MFSLNPKVYDKYLFPVRMYENQKKLLVFIISTQPNNKNLYINHLGDGLVVRAWDQNVCFLCSLRFEPCGYSYDGHWRLTWSLNLGPVGLVEVRAS